MTEPNPTRIEAERALEQSLKQMQPDFDAMVEAFSMVHEMKPQARNALLALEIVAADAFAVNVWLLHLRGEHGRAASVRATGRSVEQAVSATLKAMRG